MRILILTQYYPPETGAPQNRLSDLARRLKTFGHQVTVLTALPNYPQGKIFAAYRGHILLEEHFDEIKVVRTWVYASQKRGFGRRLLNYFSFVASSFALGFSKAGSPDVILVESPPLFLGISGLLFRAFKQAKLVLNVSDLWPESAIAMGAVKSSWMIHASRWLEDLLYRHSVLITGQTAGIVNHIRSRFPDKDVALITNGVDTDRFISAIGAEHRSSICAEFDFGGKFVVGYAGLHGLAQGLDTVIRAARLLQDQTQLLFVFFGDGPEKEKLIRMVGTFELSNVRFFSSQPAARMPHIMEAFDVAVVPLKSLAIFKGALPSKMFEAMAAGVPIILSVDGEAREVMAKARAGITIEPENPEAMAKSILELYKDKARAKTLGANGQRYVVENYNRAKIAQQFERLLVTHVVPKVPPSEMPSVSGSY